MSHTRFQRKTSSLVKRRRQVRMLRIGVVVLIAGIATGGAAWLSHYDAVSIQEVRIYGATSVPEGAIIEKVTNALDGNYLLFFSRANIFLYPSSAIRHSILSEHPHIASVGITRENLTTLSVVVDEREPYALWCGENVLPQEEITGVCYFLDEGGFVFTKAPDFTGTVFFRHYGALPSSNPIGTQFLSESLFRTISFFLDELEDAIDRRPYALAVVDDADVEIYLDDGSKLIFEPNQNLTTILENARAAFRSDAIVKADRELEYIDLRFGDKAYYRFRE